MDRIGLLAAFSQETRLAVCCFADVAGSRGRLAFPTEDRRGGRPELCRPPVGEIACACGASP